MAEQTAGTHKIGCDEYHKHTAPECCDATCWCRKPMEQTAGERIVQKWSITTVASRQIAAEIDEAIAVAREEAHAEYRYILAHAREVRGLLDVHSVCEVLDWQREQLAAKDAEAAALREIIGERCDCGHNKGKHRSSSTHEITYCRSCTCNHFRLVAALSTTVGAGLLARLSRLEMKLAQREEFIANGQVELIEYVNASVQAQAASQKALLARLRAAEDALEDIRGIACRTAQYSKSRDDDRCGVANVLQRATDALAAVQAARAKEAT